MKIRVELYGRLRDAGLGDAVELEVPGATAAGDILRAVGQKLGVNAPLLETCVLAGESRVLGANETVPLDERLAVLPPVCGG